jgi:DNA-binding NarL/FixJ family response regulator
MPVMGGYDCLKSMLAINPDAKILMASGYSGDVGIRECLELGAKGYINKPFTIAELLKQVHTFFTDEF